MSDVTGAGVVPSPPFITPAPSPMGMPEKPKPVQDPDRFLRQAKQVAVDNYNKSRDPERTPELTMEQVYIVTFTKVLGHWKALVASPNARGLMWEVTYNGYRKEAYVEIYKKLNSIKVPVGEE